MENQPRPQVQLLEQSAYQPEQLVHLSVEDQQMLGDATLQLAMEQARAIAEATPHRITTGATVGMARVEQPGLQMTNFAFDAAAYAQARRQEYNFFHAARDEEGHEEKDS